MIPNNRAGPCQASGFLNSTKFLAELEEITGFLINVSPEHKGNEMLSSFSAYNHQILVAVSYLSFLTEAPKKMK